MKEVFDVIYGSDALTLTQRVHAFRTFSTLMYHLQSATENPWRLRKASVFQPQSGPEVCFMFDAPWHDGRHVSTISMRWDVKEGRWSVQPETCSLGPEQVEHYKLFYAAAEKTAKGAKP